MRKALYPGSFDPVTLGHIDVIKRSLKLFDNLTIAIGENIKKETLFTVDERKTMLKESLNECNVSNVKVESFSGLLVKHAENTNCNVIIRGLRAMSDFDYEFQMGLMNRKLNNNIETVFLLTDLEYLYLNSSTIKDIVRLGGSASCMVPKVVINMLKDKYSK